MIFLGWIPALFLMGIIFFLSSLSGDQFPDVSIPFSDKMVHFSIYSFLGSLIAMRLGFNSWLRGKTPLQWTLGGWSGPLLGVLFGFSDEIHQLFVPLRQFEIADFLVDTLGIILGVWVMQKWDRTQKI